MKAWKFTYGARNRNRERGKEGETDTDLGHHWTFWRDRNRPPWGWWWLRNWRRCFPTVSCDCWTRTAKGWLEHKWRVTITNVHTNLYSHTERKKQAQSTCAESTRKGVNQCSKERRQTNTTTKTWVAYSNSSGMCVNTRYVNSIRGTASGLCCVCVRFFKCQLTPLCVDYYNDGSL